MIATRLYITVFSVFVLVALLSWMTVYFDLDMLRWPVSAALGMLFFLFILLPASFSVYISLRDRKDFKRMCSIFPIEGDVLTSKQREHIIHEIRLMLKYTLLVDKTPWSPDSISREDMRSLLGRVRANSLNVGDVEVLNSIVYVGAVYEDVGIIEGWWTVSFVDRVVSTIRKVFGRRHLSDADLQMCIECISRLPTFPGTTEFAHRAVCSILPDSGYIFTASNAYDKPAVTIRNKKGCMIASMGERGHTNTHMVKEQYAHVRLLQDLGTLGR